MANTDVTLINNGGVYVPSTASVAVVDGDTLSFSTSDGNAAYLFFSPDAMPALSPNPGTPFHLSPGARANFRFITSAQGAYSVLVGATPNNAPTHFAVNRTQELVLQTNLSGDLPGFSTHDTMTTGH